MGSGRDRTRGEAQSLSDRLRGKEVDEAPVHASRRPLSRDHVGFVARPEEAGKEFVARIHRPTRKPRRRPCTPTQRGGLSGTGYSPEAALRIAKLRDPLTVRRVAAGTEVAPFRTSVAEARPTAQRAEAWPDGRQGTGRRARGRPGPGRHHPSPGGRPREGGPVRHLGARHRARLADRLRLPGRLFPLQGRASSSASIPRRKSSRSMRPRPRFTWRSATA